MSVLLANVLARAASFLGVEGGQSGYGRHCGPQIDGWLATVGLAPGYPWCAAFLCSMFAASSAELGLTNPCPRTAGALHLWSLAEPTQRTHAPAPGRVFVMDHGGGLGHVGFIEAVNNDGTISTIEGDTNAAGSRVGDAVGRHTWDPTDGTRGTLVGFLDFTPVVDAA